MTRLQGKAALVTGGSRGIGRLTAAQRQELERLAATGKRSAAIVTGARLLRKADCDRGPRPAAPL